MMCDVGLYEFLRVMIDIIKVIEYFYKIGICYKDINLFNVFIFFSEGVSVSYSVMLFRLI